MSVSLLLACLLVLAGFAWLAGYGRSISVVNGRSGVKNLNSLPFYYGSYTAIWCALPALFIILLWTLFDDVIIQTLVVADLPAHYQKMSSDELSLILNTLNYQLESGKITATEPALQQAGQHLANLHNTGKMALGVLVLAIAMAGLGFSWSRIQVDFRARKKVENVVQFLLLLCSCIAILTTVGIVFSVLFEAIRFFSTISPIDFIFGLEWSPQIALRADQQAASGSFGAIPLFAGTMLISFIAMIVAVPVGLMSAIYLSEYAHSTVRSIFKPLLEILAGIPTVVYGFFAALTVAPTIRALGIDLGLTVSSESALAAGLVMGIMIIPFVSSLSDDVINAVPQSLRDGSYGLGATRSETIRKVVIPAALPGIVGGVLLAVSRAIGETMIVVMAAGLAANLTANPLDSVTTVTVQIVTLLTGDQEFDSPKTLAAFALGLTLFVVTLALNVIALQIVKRYREQYD